MNIREIAATGYGLAALLFIVMTVLLLTRWRNRSKSPILALAAFSSAAWASFHAFSPSGLELQAGVAAALEVLRCLLWVAPLMLMRRGLVIAEEFDAKVRRYWVLLPLFSVFIGLVLAERGALAPIEAIQVAVCLGFSTAIVFFAEQVFRSAPQNVGSGLKYFCLAVAGMFIYDIVFLGLTGVEGARNEDIWAARGFVNSLLVVPLFYATRKRFDVSLGDLLPRQIVFYSFSLVAVGLFMAAIYVGDFFIKRYGGMWSDVIRISLAAAILIFVGALFVSPSVRAKSRVLLIKSLFQYKYDYRREWLRFIATLSQTEPEQKVATIAVRAIAQIVNSPAGVAWAQQNGDEEYVPIGSWNCDLPINGSIERDSNLVQFLKERQWIINLDELSQHPERYDSRGCEDLLRMEEDWWLIVPMLLGDRLSGFIMLKRPGDVPVLNFEDHDLLKTAGRHVATHIEQAESDRRLAEASQFGAYNRLTAFLMHDLSNLIAQQSLVVENAERFGRNPDFIDDAIGTISHSVTRMRRLMEQLSSASKPPLKQRVDLCAAIETAVERASARMPVPVLTGCTPEIYVLADAERVSMVIEHLIRNAQEATPPNGQVTVTVDSGKHTVDVSVVDTGCGMSQEFIRTRLFRPFDSTKGSQGMGVGAYQAREYARALGGHLAVSSEPNSGTEFLLQLPLA